MLMAAAMLALMVLVAAPVIAQVKFDDHDDRFDRNDRNGFFFGDDRDRFDNDGGEVSFDLGDTENESGDIST